MLRKKDAPVVTLAMLLALAAVPAIHSIDAAIPTIPAAQAQVMNSLDRFPSLAKLENATVRMVGSESMTHISQNLRDSFARRYPGSKVEITPESTNAALRSVAEGRADLAMLGRPLTQMEKEQGLVEVPIARHKIAIITSSDNPFAKGLTNDQFAQIFRGQINNWSAVGGPDMSIRMIDQTADSDTRQSLARYPVFQKELFTTGANAVNLPDNRIESIVERLGSDGIGYVIADQAMGREGVKIVPLHQVLPDDARYSFSQPLSYVYKGPSPNEAVKGFLGYVNDPNVQTAITQARTQDAVHTSISTAPSPTDQIEKHTIANNRIVPVTAAAQTNKGWDWSKWILPLLGLTVGAPFLAWLLYGMKKRDGRRPTGGHRRHDEGYMPDAPMATGMRGGTLAAGTAAGAGAMAMATHHSPQIILVPRDCRHAYAYWEVTHDQMREMKQKGGQTMKLRLYDVTNRQVPHLVQQLDCDEQNADLPIDITLDQHDYRVELGYLTRDNTWLRLASSDPVNVPSCDVLPIGKAQPDTPIALPAPQTSVTPQMPVIPQMPVAPIATAGLAAGAAGIAAGMAAKGHTKPPSEPAHQGQTDPQHQRTSTTPLGRVILVPRSDTEAYAYWEVPERGMQTWREQGQPKLSLRLYDVTDLSQQELPHLYQQFDCNVHDSDVHLNIPNSNRNYVAQLGYRNAQQQWVCLAQSNRTHLAQPVTTNGSHPHSSPANGSHPIVSAPAVEHHRTAANLVESEQQGRLVIMSRIPQRITVGAPSDNEARVYVYWDIPEVQKQQLRQQVGDQLVLRIYDATNIDLDYQPAHSFRQYPITANARDMVVPVPTRDRDYVAEIGYLGPNGKLSRVLRSVHTHVPTAVES